MIKKRFLAVLMVVVMLVGMIPAQVFATEASQNLGTVSSLTEGISISQDGADVNATFAGTLQWVAADPTIGRSVDGWWVGIKVTAPEGMTQGQLQNVQYIRSGSTNSFWSNMDSQSLIVKNGETVDSDAVVAHYITLWGLVTPEFMEAALKKSSCLSTYTWEFDWYGDGNTQTVKLSIDARNTVLMQDGVRKYACPYGLVESLSENITYLNGIQTGELVEATFTGTLPWVEANPDIGRIVDGWWAGIKVTAPEYYDAEKASYKNGETVKSFKEFKDGDNYIGLWGLTKPEYLEAALNDDGLSTYTWEFDWDGDQVFEQTIKLHFKADETVLLDDENVTFGTVTKLTEEISFAGDIQNAQKVEATFAGTLQWVAADPTIGRIVDGWWAGIKLTAPEGMTQGQLQNAKYRNGGSVKSFWDYMDSKNQVVEGDLNAVVPHYITLWGLTKPDFLMDALADDGLSSYTWEFDWNGNGVYEQTVVLNFDANQITLMENGVQRYPADLGTVSCYTDGASIVGNGTGDVKVTIEQAELKYSPADPSIGRNEPGWWAGIKVTVPEALKDENSEEVLKKIKFQVKGDPAIDWKDVEEKDFYDFKDSSSAPHYIQMWVHLTPTILAQFISQGKSLTRCYRFNWDGENEYEQEITFSVICSDKIKLSLEGTEPTISNTKAYVDSNGKTQLSFNFATIHNLAAVYVNGAAVNTDNGVCQWVGESAMETVEIRVVDEYGGETTQEVTVQQKLAISIGVPDAVHSANGAYYYNENNLLTFAFNVENSDSDAYKVVEFKLYDDAGYENADIRILNAGQHTISKDYCLVNPKVEIKDATGRIATYTLEGTYIYDTKLPVVTITPSTNITGFYTAENGEIYAILNNPIQMKNNSVTVFFDVTVEDQLSLDTQLYPETAGWTISDNQAKKRFAVNVADHNNGQIDLTFVAKDLAQHIAGSYVVRIGENEDAPTLKLDSNPEGKFSQIIHIDRRVPSTDNNTAVPTIKITAKAQTTHGGIFYKDSEIYAALTDNGSGIASVTYSIQDAAGAVAAKSDVVPQVRADGRYMIPIVIAEGKESNQVILTLIVKDNVGNTYEFHKQLSVDKKTPEIDLVDGNVTVGNQIAYYQNGATFQFAVAELSSYTLNWTLDDGAEGSFLALETENETANVTILPGAINETTATLSLTATDVHGHTSEVYTISFVVDNKAPEVEVTVDAKDFVQTRNGVDYFEADVNYKVSVSDRYLDISNVENTAVYALFEDGSSKEVKLTGENTYTGTFTVEDGQILTNIEIRAKDNAGNYAKSVNTVVENSETVSLSFAENEQHIWNCSSHDVAVDCFAPEVLVTIQDQGYVQTVNGVDYFNQEVTYGIEVSDKFMEEGTYTLDVKLFYEGAEMPESVRLVRDEDPETTGDRDVFVGSFTVTNGKVLKDILINVLDASGQNPDEIRTAVALSTSGRAVTLNFAENDDGIFGCISNDVVVDMTAPVVNVTTSAADYIQTMGEYDYFAKEVEYVFTVTDQFMEEDTYTLDVQASFEDGSTELVTLNNIAYLNDSRYLIGNEDTFVGSLVVTDGKVLKGLEITVLDAVSHRPEEILVDVEDNMTEGATQESIELSFGLVLDENDLPTDTFARTSNNVIVDMTAPEITVEKSQGCYTQSLEGYDYYNDEVTYIITMTDAFLDNYTESEVSDILVQVIYQDENVVDVPMNEPTEPETTEPEVTEPENTEPAPQSEPEVTEPEATNPEVTEPRKMVEQETYQGSFTVVNGQAVTGITIKLVDNAGNMAELEVIDGETEKTLVNSETTVEPEDLRLTTFKDGQDKSWTYNGNAIVVDTTSPAVHVTFSENVENFYVRGDHLYVNLKQKAENDNNSEELSNEEMKNFTMTVTVNDKNLYLDENLYGLKVNQGNGSWEAVGEISKNGPSAAEYIVKLENIQPDSSKSFVFDLSVFDLAGNAALDVTDNISEEDNRIACFQPENGIIGATVVVDRVRPGSFYDQNKPTIETTTSIDPVYTLKDDNRNDIPLYAGEFDFAVTIADGDMSDEDNINKNSGLESIKWTISDEVDVIYTATEIPEIEDDQYLFEGNIDVSVANGVGESNWVTLTITATDRVGNVNMYVKHFALDNQAPRINVEYNDPAGNSPYFRETRTATISVTDINFNADATTVWVQPNTERSVNWTSTDSKTYVGTVIYAEEGDYEFSMTTTDLAGNVTTTSKDTFPAPEVTINGPTNATHVFTIDKTAPTIAVVYSPATPVDRDEEGVEYFDTDRSAEVTITDVNFTAQETKVTAGDQSWTHPYRGQDNKYGTVFGEGNNYQVEVTSADKAGNVATPYKGVPFSVDKTKPTIQITTGDMTDEGLNIVQDDLILGFTINDTNSNLKTTSVVMTHLNNEFKPVTVTGDAYYEQRNELDRTTRYVDVTNIAKEKLNDGIYTIEISALDYAGRTENFVLYMSVNRFGSSFIITDAYTKEFFSGDLNAAIYHNAVENNLIIQEINPNAVWQNGEEKGQEGSVITMAFNGNAKELIPNTNYSVTTEKKGEGKNTWYVYTYEIFKDNFYANGELVDGRYKLLFYSEDEAGNRNANETNADSHLTSYEDGSTAGTAEFVLDHQKPVVAIIGIAAGQEISEDNQIVEITIADNTAVSIVAYIDDTMIELGQYSENMPTDKTWFVYNEQTGKYMLNVVKSNRRQDVKFVATDAAGNQMEYYVNRVLVTKNVIVQYFNNVPALCITAVVLIAAIVFFIILKKKKKEENKG